MARFVLKSANPATLKRFPAEEVFEGSSVAVGSRAAHELPAAEHVFAVRDGALAPQHLRIRAAAGGRFLVEELPEHGTASGTFLNGRPVERAVPLHEGAVLVAGNSRFDVATCDAEKGELVLVGSPWRTEYTQDPLRWARAEPGLGRSRAVRWGSWLAALLVVVAVPWLAVDRRRAQTILSPGPLRHTARFAEILEEDAAHPDLRATARTARARFEQEDCALCHAEARQAMTVATCATGDACHAGLDAPDVHPRGRWPGGPPATVEGAVGRLGCVDCHVEHRESIIPPFGETEATCARCHEKRPAVEVAVEPQDEAPREVPLRYRTFSHTSHRTVECDTCHVPPGDDEDAEGTREQKDWSDFLLVTFERCQECHAPGANPEAPDHPATWHGTEPGEDGVRGANCLRCHETLGEAELTRVTTQKPGPERRFGLTTRPHPAADYEDALWNHPETGTKSCEDCHRRGLELEGRRELGSRPFPHELHVAELRPGSAAASAGCRPCHGEVMDAASFAGASGEPVGVWRREACGETCHRAADDGGSGLVELEPVEPVQVERIDFPHTEHLGFGCDACHEPERVPGAIDAKTFSTDPAAADCTDCHTRKHEEVGGGSCEHCHVMDVDANDAVDDAVYGDEPFIWKRAGSRGFDHFSRGHRRATERDCTGCHGEIPSEDRSFETIDALPLPDESATVCVDCHRGRRFHRPVAVLEEDEG